MFCFVDEFLVLDDFHVFEVQHDFHPVLEILVDLFEFLLGRGEIDLELVDLKYPSKVDVVLLHVSQ